MNVNRGGAYGADLREMKKAVRDKNEKSGFRGVKEKSERNSKAYCLVEK